MRNPTTTEGPSESNYVYVMGRGHSGSTVLDSLLGHHPDAVGVGEMLMGVVRLEELEDRGYRQESIELWRSIRSNCEERLGECWEEIAQKVYRPANVFRFPQGLVAAEKSEAIQQNLAATRTIVDELMAHTGADLVVDSSKEVTRALTIARFMPEARIVHLVRRPENVLASDLSRIREGSGYRFLRRTYRSRRLEPLYMAMTAAGWTVGNLLCEIVRIFAADRSIRVRYEDLCDDPVGELSRIGAFLGRDMFPVIEKVENRDPMPVGPKLAGNRMRQAGEFVFDPKRKSARHLPDVYRVLSKCITMPLRLRYKYGLS